MTFVLIGAIARVLPHAPNFAPIGAIALFGGAHMSKKQALTLPIVAMILSDYFIGFDSLEMRLSVYGSFLLIVGLGMLLKKHLNYKTLATATLASSMIFFLITNLSVWAFGSMYPKTFAGLVDAFVMAIPFFRNTILGDFFYSGLFFGGYELVRYRKVVPILQK